MRELLDEIARGEIRCEQIIIHLRESGNSPGSEVERLYLFSMLENLVRLKTERERREDLRALVAA